jgi:hypothetical protein
VFQRGDQHRFRVVADFAKASAIVNGLLAG